jgi:IS5 family transposase
MVGAMSQLSFGDAEYAGKRKQTRREIFLAEMELVVPWKSLLGLIEPFYPEAGNGRPPYPLPTMLRVHLMQNWFGLSDPAMEEALYEITPMRLFAGLSLDKPIPDETTILNFRHLLEANELAPEILGRVNAYLGRKGLMLKRGSIVDATIIAARMLALRFSRFSIARFSRPSLIALTLLRLAAISQRNPLRSTRCSAPM